MQDHIKLGKYDLEIQDALLILIKLPLFTTVRIVLLAKQTPFALQSPSYYSVLFIYACSKTVSVLEMPTEVVQLRIFAMSPILFNKQSSNISCMLYSGHHLNLYLF